MTSAFRPLIGALGLALALAGCRGEDIACDGDAVVQKVVEAARTQYPNAASNALLQRGSVAALNRVLKEQNLDPSDEAQRVKAANEAVADLERAYKAGRFVLESIETVKSDEAAKKISCRARMVLMTSWGIGVRDVTYDASREGQTVNVKLEGLQ